MPIFLLLWKKHTSLLVPQINHNIVALKKRLPKRTRSAINIQNLKNVFHNFRLNIYNCLIKYLVLGNICTCIEHDLSVQQHLQCIPIEVIVNEVHTSINLDNLSIRNKNSLLKNATYLFAFFSTNYFLQLWQECH